MLMRGRGLRATGMGNDQIPVSQYTGPVGGFSCNTAGGYALRKPSCSQVSICMTDGDFAAAEAACNAPVQPAPVITSSPSLPASPSPSLPSGGTFISPSSAVASTDIMFGTFDASSFVGQYKWWLAGGVGAIVLLSVLNK